MSSHSTTGWTERLRPLSEPSFAGKSSYLDLETTFMTSVFVRAKDYPPEVH